MLRVVEVHPASSAQGEYIVLQNLGVVTINLRGWAVCTEAYLSAEAQRVADEMYIFRQEVSIRPYTRVVLFTGQGRDGWVPTTDGQQAYCAYWQRAERVWTHAARIHLLHIAGTKRVGQVATI